MFVLVIMLVWRVLVLVLVLTLAGVVLGLASVAVRFVLKVFIMVMACVVAWY